MGPYCNFCNNRYFTNFPALTPDHVIKAYGTATIIATCPKGQEYEKKRVGYCYADIMKLILENEKQSPVSTR